MALDKDILGTALHNARQTFANQSFDDLIAIYGTLDGIRLAASKADAQAIIDHFKANGVLTVPGAGLVAPSGGGAVTGNSITGKIA